MEVIRKVQDFKAVKPRFSVLIVGDFNMILNTQIDRFPLGKQGTGRIYPITQCI